MKNKLQFWIKKSGEKSTILPRSSNVVFTTSMLDLPWVSDDKPDLAISCHVICKNYPKNH